MQERELYTNEISTTVRFDDVKRLVKQGVQSLLTQIAVLFPATTARWALKIFSTPRMKDRPAKGIFIDAQFELIEVDGLKAKVYQFGEESKPTILIVHGWEGLAQDFYVMVEELVQNGYRVITFDGPAHDKSLGEQTNALEFSRIISHLALMHGPFKAIIAHSFGGFAASLALAQYKKEIAEKIITIGSPNRLSRVIEAFSSFLNLPERVVEKMNHHIAEKFQLVVEDTSTAKSLEASSVDVLVVHDENDEQVNINSAMEIVSQVQESTYLRTNGLGHNRILRNREVALTIIQFIQGKAQLLTGQIGSKER